MQANPHPLTLTVEQVAKVLGIGRSTAYELVHTGAIPSLRLGRRIVVPTAKLAASLGVSADSVPGEGADADVGPPSRDEHPGRQSETPSPSLF